VPNFIEKYYFLPKLLNVEYRLQKYLRNRYGVTQVNPSVTVRLRDSNKQQLILTKFYVDSAPSVGNQSAKF